MSSKYLKDLEVKKTKIIHVYPNGDAYARATFILLRLLEQKDLERIIRAIEEKVRLPLNRPIRKLFEMTGVLVTSFIQVEDGKYYVAASTENFLPMEYGHGLGWVRVGPVRTDKYANVRFVSRSEEEGTSKSLNSSHTMLSSTKDTIKMAKRQKSPAKRTPANLKKASRQSSVPKKSMVTSEQNNSPPLLDQIQRDDEERDRSLGVVEHEPDDGGHGDSGGFHNKEEESYNQREYEDSLNNDIAHIKTGENGHIETGIDGNVYEAHPQEDSGCMGGENRDHTQEDLGYNGRGTRSNHEEEEEVRICEVENVEDSRDEQLGNEYKDEVINADEKEHDFRVEDQNNEVQSDDVVRGDVQEDIEGRYDEAATKIQATFRGHRVRNELDRKKDIDGSQNLDNDNTDVSEEINSQKDE